MTILFLAIGALLIIGSVEPLKENNVARIGLIFLVVGLVSLCCKVCLYIGGSL